MKYIHKPTEIEAFKITNVTELGGNASPGYGARLTLEDGSEFDADGTMTARYWPKVGDYLLFAPQPDGGPAYPYLQPAAVFESKYDPSEVEKPLTVGDAVKLVGDYPPPEPPTFVAINEPSVAQTDKAA